MDEADIAQHHIENEIAATVGEASIPYVKDVSSWEEGPELCENCGMTIPEARRKALPGVQFCVDCAEELGY